MTHPSALGKLVTVIELAPIGQSFRLPDGQLHTAVGSEVWIIESLGAPFDAPVGGSSWRKAMFGCSADKWLLPIRPGNVTDDEVRELYAPKQPEVVS